MDIILSAMNFRVVLETPFSPGRGGGIKRTRHARDAEHVNRRYLTCLVPPANETLSPSFNPTKYLIFVWPSYEPVSLSPPFRPPFFRGLLIVHIGVLLFQREMKLFVAHFRRVPLDPLPTDQDGFSSYKLLPMLRVVVARRSLQHPVMEFAATGGGPFERFVRVIVSVLSSGGT